MSTLAQVIVRDVIGSRPAAAIPGRLFAATDERKLYRDTGITWEEIVASSYWGNLGGTLSDQTDLQAALDDKQDVANKSTSTSLGSSDTLYPSQKAVKTYVDETSTPAPVTPPTSSSSDGVAGTWAYNSGYLYICTQTSVVSPPVSGVWARIALTW